MLLSWWCPLGHGKRHLPAIQIFIAVRLISILTARLSSRWTVPLTWNFVNLQNYLTTLVMNKIVQKHFLVGSLPGGRDHRCPPGCWAGVGPAPGSPPGHRSTYPQHNTIFPLQGNICLHSIQQNRPMDQIYSKTPNSKCRLWPVKVLGGRCLSVWGPPPPPMTPYPPLTNCIRVYIILMYTEKGGERANQRECYWGITVVHKAKAGRSKIPTWLTVSPVYKLY